MKHTSSDTQALFEDYLSQPEWGFNWFITQTFDKYKCGYIRRDPRRFDLALHREIVMESWNFFVDIVGKEANACWGWMFAEQHVSGQPHWHSMFHVQESLLGAPRRDDTWRRMFDKYGRCEIKPIRGFTDSSVYVEGCGLARYLTKYVAKDQGRGQDTYDFKGFLSGREATAKEIFRASGLAGAKLAADSR
jgi:hypothetical protein